MTKGWRLCQPFLSKKQQILNLSFLNRHLVSNSGHDDFKQLLTYFFL